MGIGVQIAKLFENQWWHLLIAGANISLVCNIFSAASDTKAKRLEVIKYIRAQNNTDFSNEGWISYWAIVALLNSFIETIF